ncbi:DUF4282 domain-containing protein [Nocardia blacklockiae]|uniref:DUF4282 domain-containing protein n=1 Tax=Nocardia blacklockiae TaxID=480036 RepID=UPI00189326FB|nr:DUF4282 domain-containing protein [Nocardia blacklockiae]MBF6173455.1 DUF4282 domain-containing protein [Nocardia blacklockiae]
MTDEPLGPPPDPAENYEAEPRFIAWKESAGRRLTRHIDEDPAEERPAEPFRSPGAFGAWAVSALRALVDVQFRRPATRTLLPLAYMLGLAFACGLPVVLTVLLWRVSPLLGLAFAVLVAVPLALTVAASVRLALEFLVNASRLADRVQHINDLADDLFRALSEVAEPVNQLSEDVRAVQFWRFRRRK